MKLPHWPVPYGTKNVKLGLNRMLDMLSRIGNPHKKLPPVIHVAGTNGKGSTIAYLKAIMEAAGYKVHRYTSPHLMRFNERITIAGHEIEDNYLTEIIEECRIAAKDLQLTFFEGTTAAAFLAFSRHKADVLLLETGLGGRLDATNVIDKPLMSIITPISMDHVEYLGETLKAIATEKAGIIKKRSNCVISWQQSEVMNVLIKKCQDIGATYDAWGVNWDFHGQKNHFVFQTSENSTIYPIPSLYGIHQIINAATAVAAVEFLDEFHKIDHRHINYGLTHAIWPARLQRIKEGALFAQLDHDLQGSELWLDGAHNVGGAEMLLASIENMHEKLPLYIIHGRSKDRDIKSFLKFFLGKTTFLCATHIKSEPLSEKSEKIHEIALEMGFDAACSDSVQDALVKCIEHADSKKIRLLICGSLYLLGDVLAHYHD